MRAALMAVAAVLGFASAAVPHARAAEAPIAVADPRGDIPDIARVPLAPRLSGIAGKRIYLVKSWPDNSGFIGVTAELAKRLEAQGAKVTVKDRNVLYSDDDPPLCVELKEKADAFVYIVAASSSTTHYAFKWSAKLEKMGLPGVVVNFDSLNNVGDHTNAREGAQVRRAPFHYPPEAMDKAAYEAAMAKVVAGLTAPLTAEERRTGVIPSVARPAIAMTGTSDEVQAKFYANGWTDGLPVVPPTAERIARMLKGTSHRPDEVVAPGFPPEGLRTTVRHVAINGVMAGCGPEHMAVLLATIEAVQKYELNSILRSTAGFAFMQVVNGPIRNELHMNSGTFAIGPGNRSNSCMGRALRLFITNLGGGEYGVNLMGVFGSVTADGFMFAENEEQSPWGPLSADHGFKKGESTLSFFTGGWAHMGNYGLGTVLAQVPPDIARFQLRRGAVLMVAPARAAQLARDGMSKDDVKRYLLENATRTLGDLRIGRFIETPESKGKPDDARIRTFPDGWLDVVVVGNDVAPMMQAWEMFRPQVVSIDRWR